MKNNTNENQKWSESFFVKSIMAGFALLTSIANLIVAITKLIEGENIIAIIATIGFVVFLAIGVIAFSLRTVQRNSGIKS